MSRLVPAYFHPAVAGPDWTRLAGAGVGDAGYVVVNVADGPGQDVEPALGPQFVALGARGLPLLGYVDTGYGRRPAAEVLRDAMAWRTLYGVTGVFCDRISADPAHFAQESALTDGLRAGGAAVVALNPGRRPEDPRYADICDVLVSFEGPWEAYRPQAGFIPAAPGRARICHLVHEVPDRDLDLFDGLARTRGADLSYASPLGGANPWRRLSPVVK